jgi:endonuclease YncB( thermonuclease family)
MGKALARYLWLVIGFAFTTALIADELRGKVVSIADGDTITVLDDNKKQNKVRLNGIDAPEKKQAFGAKSKARLGELVAGKDVVVEWKEKDKYGRIVGQIYQGSLDVNLQMVKEGLAWHYKKYSKSAELSRAEAEAKAGKKGLWADPNPVPPWEFRRTEKSKKK